MDYEVKNLDSFPRLPDKSLCIFRSVFSFLCALISVSSSLLATFLLTGFEQPLI